MTPQVISLSAAGSTAWIPVDYKQNPYNIDIAVVLSNTPNLTYKVEYTLDDVFNPAITPTAFSHGSLVGLTANATGTIKSPVRAIRLTITSWTSGTATMTALQGVVNPTLYTSLGGVRVLQFPDFKKCLLASLALTSTASRTSNVVTITATAHGITTGTTYVGFRFFYPGSPSLAAGWYDSIVSIPDANTITFNAPGANFGSESVNGGAAYTTLTTISGQCIIPGGLLTDNNVVRVAVPGGGGLTGATKSIKLVINSTGLHTATATGFPFNIREWEIFSILSNSLACAFIQYNGASSSFTTVAVDKSQDIAVQFQASVSAAADFVTLYTPPRAIIY